MDLLQKIKCKTAIYKASCDPNRFPKFGAILVPWFQHNLAFNSNIEILFGSVSNVRHLLLEIGANFANPPPQNSPLGAIFSKFFQQGESEKVASGTKACAECGSSEKTKNYYRCPACKTAHYCNSDCQQKHWPIHRPNCLRAQGKSVPESVIAKAKRVSEEREEEERKKTEQRYEQGLKEFETIISIRQIG